jgi:prolyl 4-hydroxylase
VPPRHSPDDGNVCLPDGTCYDSLEEALEKFSTSRSEEKQFVSLSKPKNFGEAQQVAGKENSKTLQVLADTYTYMDAVYKNATTRDFRDGCRCYNELCAFWAAIGECEKNPGYMLLQCAPVCQTCHQLSFEHRCPFDKNAPTAWGPGDLNKLFERITTEPYYVETYQPNILSRPPEGPWVITMENVASEEECQTMIDLGAARGYERSQDVGERKFDGTFASKTQDTRTSHNTWCLDECYNHTAHQDTIKRVENITGIPDTNSEYWQFLQYQEGQFYAEHHDYIPFHLERSQGVRILTVFLYLNDVEEGGGTHFGRLGITVQPKRGRVVVWPSVYDHDPNKKDPRTHHEALPVKKGIKYGANAWIHQRSFKDVFGEGCS